MLIMEGIMIDQCGRKRDLIGLGSPAPRAFVYLSI